MRPTSRRHILTEQINAYETRLQYLMEDYKSLQVQLASETNSATQNAFNRQILELENKVEETQRKLDELAEKIQQFDHKNRTQQYSKRYPPPNPRGKPPLPHPPLTQSGITIEFGGLRKYLPFVAFTVITLLLWSILANHGISLHSQLSRNPDEYKSRLTLYGLLGGTTNGILLFLATSLRNSSQKLLASTSLLRAVIYCGSGALLGSVAWHITESNVQSKGNPAYYGDGAWQGAIVCIVISIVLSSYCFYVQSKERDKRKLNR